jgi:hypothetical protein
MNVFSRVVLALIFLALTAGAIAVIALAWSIPNDSIDGLQDAVDWLRDNNNDDNKILLTVIAAAAGLVSLVLFVAEITPRSPNDVKVTDLQVGDAVLSTAAIGQRVEEAVSQVPHISEVRALVRPKRKGVVVSLDLHVDPDANLATVADEASEAARDVLNNRVHVALAEPPKARLHYRELRMRNTRPRTLPEYNPPASTSPPAEAPEQREAEPATSRSQPNIWTLDSERDAERERA